MCFNGRVGGRKRSWVYSLTGLVLFVYVNMCFRTHADLFREKEADSVVFRNLYARFSQFF